MEGHAGRKCPRWAISFRWGVLPLLIAGSVTALAISWWSGGQASLRLDSDMRLRLLQQTREIVSQLNTELVKKLTGTEADKDKPAFQRLREELRMQASTIPHGRWIYGIAEREGKLVFPIDVALNGAERERPPAEPGEVYDDASDGVKLAVARARELVEGPCADKWGTFVSALVPLVDQNTGKMVMIVGLDIEAGRWQATVDAERYRAVGMMATLLLIAWGSIILFRRRIERRSIGARELRRWIVLPTGLAMLAALAFYWTTTCLEVRAVSERKIRDATDMARNEWYRHVNARVNVLKSRIEGLDQNEAVLDAWTAGDVPALLALAEPEFKRWKANHGITHFYFLGPDRTCLLRVHQPNRRGDRIDRFTALASERTGEDEWGVELGPLGTCTLRYVKPWRHEGRLIGYLELGTEVSGIAEELAHDMNLEFVAIVRKQHLTAESFAAARKQFGFSGDWDDYPDFVVTSQSIQDLPPELRRFIAAGRCEDQPFGVFVSSDDRKQYGVGVVHQRDAGGRNVADLLLLLDMTGHATGAQGDLIQNLGLAVVVAGGLVFLLYLVTGRAQNQVVTTLERLQSSEQQFRSLFESALTSVAIHELILDAQDKPVDYTYLRVNAAFEQHTGLRAEQVIGKRASKAIPGAVAAPFLDVYAEVALTGKPAVFDIYFEPLKRHFHINAFQLSPGKFATVFQDISESKRLEDELRAAARTDRLTGLPNRALLCDRLQQAVLRSKRIKDYHFAVLFLDFDRFKLVNDSLGHDIGDQLLREISQRLRTAVRSGDSLHRQAREHTTARLGGDEFVILLDGIASPVDATLVANRMLEIFAEPYRIGDHLVYSTASIGIVTSDMPAENAEEVLRDADTAMYEAKLAGKGQYMIFNVSMRQRVQDRLHMENDLRGALEARQLFLVYQPIISLQTGEIESFEALLRWKHPARGLISPGEFIPVAEDTGLILSIGEWVLHEACAQFAQWRQSMGAAAPRSISVNLSRNQLALPNLAGMIQRILQQTGVDSGCLHLEVTESAVMKDPVMAAEMLRAIKSIGVKLDMDDFGTGYSSLSCLHQFPIDVLKIDRSFVANIDRGRDFAALVHAVTQLARNLNISVVAEGIESTEQAMVLQSLECDFGQGYHFGRPMPADQVPGFRVKCGMLPGSAASDQPQAIGPDRLAG